MVNLDPNIPFIPEITPDIPYEEPTKCYDLCHIRHNSTELIVDSLSKYEPYDCPDTSIIAESVRSDPRYVDQSTLRQHISSTSSQPSNRTVSLPGDSGNRWNDIDASEDDIVGLGDNSPVSTQRPATSSAKDTTGGDLAGGTKGPNGRVPEVHRKKLSDLREVLAVYKNQPRTHHFGHHSEPTSVDTSKSAAESIWARWVG